MSTLTLDLGQSYFAKLLNDRNAFRNIYDISGGYGKATQIVTLLNKGNSVQINTADSKKEEFTIDHQGVVANVGSQATSGANLILTLTDPSYDFFRDGDIIIDTSRPERAQGYVESHSPGTVTVSPYNTTAFSATAFLANSTATGTWDSSPNRGSVGKESLYATPDTVFNWGSIKRDSVELSRRDFSSTYMDSAISQANWATSQETFMVQRFAQRLEYATLFEERGQKTINGKVHNSNGSLLWAIQNRGGTHVVNSSDLTEQKWKDLIELVTKKDAVGSQRLTFLHGRAALSKIQSFTEDFVKQSGIHNTFGGPSVSGIDVQTYAYLGTIIDFVYLPILDDEKMFPTISTITGKQRMSSSFFLCDFAPVLGAGTKGMLPAIERFHFDREGIRYGFIPGMIGPEGGDPSSYQNAGKFLMANDADAVSCEMLMDGGVDIVNARKMLFFELES